MPSIKGPVLRGKSTRGDDFAYVWCSRLDKAQKYMGRDHVRGVNCVIEVPATRKCTVVGNDGVRIRANCIQNAFIYKGFPGHRVEYRRHK